MQTIRIDNRDVAYYDHGAGEPVLLLHPGFVADGMLPLLDHSSLSSYRLIAPHRPGYGSSDAPTTPPGMPELARDALSLLDVLGLERAHLVGHSFGACVALEIARTQPQRAARIVLLEPPLGFALSRESVAIFMTVASEAISR